MEDFCVEDISYFVYFFVVLCLYSAICVNFRFLKGRTSIEMPFLYNYSHRRF